MADPVHALVRQLPLLRPTDEVHLFAEVAPQACVLRVAEFGEVVLKLRPEPFVELAPIHDDLARINAN